VGCSANGEGRIIIIIWFFIFIKIVSNHIGGLNFDESVVGIATRYGLDDIMAQRIVADFSPWRPGLYRIKGVWFGNQ